MDRVHRLGQGRAVEVWRYVAEASIEERMLLLQVGLRHIMSCHTLKGVSSRDSFDGYNLMFYS